MLSFHISFALHAKRHAEHFTFPEHWPATGINVMLVLMSVFTQCGKGNILFLLKLRFTNVSIMLFGAKILVEAGICQ